MSRQDINDTDTTEPNRRDAIRAAVHDALRHHTGAISGTLRDDMTLAEIGLDSFAALKVRARIADTLDRHLDLVDLLGHFTVDQLVTAAASAPAAPRLAATTDISGPDTEQPAPPAFAPLTPVQQAYWTGRDPDLADGGVASFWYHEYRRRPDLEPFADIARLRTAFARLVRHHPMLRVRIDRDGRQHIRDTVPVDIHIVDARDHTAAELDALTVRTRDAWSHRMLDTDRDLLFELHAVIHPDGTIRVCVGFDVLAIDFASWRLLMRQWGELTADHDTPLPSPTATFFDAVAANRTSPRHERARNWWHRQIDELAPGPVLAGAEPDVDHSVTPRRFSRVQRCIEAPAWELLQQRASARGLSATAVVAAAFSLVLDRWGARDPFALNLTLFDRPAEFVDVVGDFTTTGPMNCPQAPVTAGSDFTDHARDVNHRLWDVVDHREYSGVDVVRDLAHRTGEPLSATHPVVFTSGLGYDGPAPTEWLGDEIFGVSQTPQVHLDHLVWTESGCLRMIFDHALDRVPAEYVESVANAEHTLLTALSESDDAWHRTDLGWDPTFHTSEAPLPLRTDSFARADPLLDGPVRAAAALHAGLTAVLTPDGSSTHGDLDRLVRSAAAQLRASGVRSGEPVIVSVAKGLDQIVAVHALLRLGAAYVPVDPSWPSERIERIRTRSGARYAVIGTDGAALPADLTALPVTGMRDHTASPLPGDPDVAPAEMAYVIFTSGSTGEPKGVTIEHRQARTTIDDVVERFGICSADRVLALSALSFDLSVFDLFGVLGAGGAIVVPDPSRERDPQHWLDLIDRHAVTVWNTAPAVLEMLVEYCAMVPDAARALRSLRLVMLSGDWIPVTLPDRIRALVPDIEFVSLGGATEASIWSIHHRVGDVDPESPSIPYGRPLSRQFFHVLDENGVPCPVGVPGELHIGGEGVARGYIGAPELTAQRFAVHPVTGHRLYRTGDLGQWLPSGDIRFSGRNDRQVKIRGHRIELPEIESVLTRHPSVRRAVVSVTAGGSARRLVAHICPEKGQALDVFAVREHLRRHVPDYMIPAHIHAVDDIPLTGNGKVDTTELERRLAAGENELSAPASLEHGTSEQDAEHSELEMLVRSTLGEHVDVDGIRTLTEQGLTSLDLTRLANAVEDRYGTRPSVVDLAMGWEWLQDYECEAPIDSDRHNVQETSPAPRPAEETGLLLSDTADLAVFAGIDAPQDTDPHTVAHVLRAAARWLETTAASSSVRVHVAPEPGVLVRLSSARPPAGESVNVRAMTVPTTPVEQQPHRTVLSPDPAAEPDETFALTEMQLAYLVGRADRSVGGPVAPHYYTEAEIDTEGLDVTRLARAFDDVQRRHPMLRARITSQSRQTVEPNPLSQLVVHDHTTANTEVFDAHLATLRRTLSHRVADPSTDPTIVLHVSLGPDGRGRLHLSLDLLFCDAQSAVIVISDLAALHAGRGLAGPGRRFTDWISEIESRRASTRRTRNLGYWQQRAPELGRGPEIPVVEPASLPRFRRRRWESTAAELSALDRQARSRGASLTALLFAILGAACAALTPGTGNTIVVTTFGRPEDHAGVVGDYTQTMLVEPRPVPGTSFTDYVRATARDMLTGMDHSAGPDGVHANEIIRTIRRSTVTDDISRFPVVFSSGIGSTTHSDGTSADASELLDAFAHGGSHTVYAISQTPQVLVDFQVFVHDTRLRINLDTLDTVLAPGFADRLHRMIVDAVGYSRSDAMWDRPVEDVFVAMDTSASEPLPAMLTAIALELDLASSAVDPDATFFELGATSVTLVGMLPTLQRILGPELTVLDVFAYPTARSLVAHIRGERDLRPADSEDPLARARLRGSRRLEAMRDFAR